MFSRQEKSGSMIEIRTYEALLTGRMLLATMTYGEGFPSDHYLSVLPFEKNYARLYDENVDNISIKNV